MKHPHSDSLSSAASEDTPNSLNDAHHRSEVFDLSMSSTCKSALSSSAETTSVPTTPVPTTPDPTVSVPTASDPVTSAPVTSYPGSDVGGYPIAMRTESRKLSKREKKFQLSRDDGKYAELNPINPHEARKEYGDTLRLNPVGPAFGGVASLEEGQVITSHNTSSIPGSEGSKCNPYTAHNKCPHTVVMQYVILKVNSLACLCRSGCIYVELTITK